MPEPALNLAQVLWDERQALAGRELFSALSDGPELAIGELGDKPFAQLGPADLPRTYQILNADDRWALCCSGGGIRSAAFALGIAQCFADRKVVSKHATDTHEPILQQFDYLSTVSGGGYFGSWLSAWLYQSRGDDDAGHASVVLTSLNRQPRALNEAEPITNLRRDSHYLAPKFSGLSPDIWSDIATIARNLILNWLLLIPPIVLIVLALKALAFRFADVLSARESVDPWTDIVIGGAIIFFLIALSFAVAFGRAAR